MVLIVIFKYKKFFYDLNDTKMLNIKKKRERILKILEDLRKKVFEDEDWETINPPRIFRLYYERDVEEALKQIEKVLL